MRLGYLKFDKKSFTRLGKIKERLSEGARAKAKAVYAGTKFSLDTEEKLKLEIPKDLI